MDNYKKLQELIKEYENTKIWKYVDGDDIFKLDGFDEQIYVSIMGRAGLDCSIAIYYGEQDLLSQMDISFGQYKNSPDAFLRLSAYKIEIGDPGNLLNKEDKKQLKKHNIKPKNVTIRLDAGKTPRLITEEETLFLIDILKRIIAIANYIINRDFKIELVKPKYMYCFNDNEGTIIAKQIKWPILKYEFTNQQKLNQDLIGQMTWINNTKTLEIGMFYLPMFIEETKSYPRIIIIYDGESDLIIDMIIVNDNEIDMIAHNILKSLINRKTKPSKITFNSNEIVDICKDIIMEFELLFRVDENMDNLFDIWIDMYENAK